MSCEPASLLVDAIGLVGGAIAFLIGLAQYRRAQQWKRAEFLAKEVKELKNDPYSATALIMVDWPERYFRLYALEDVKNQDFTLVTYAKQICALRPHVVKLAAVGDCASGPTGTEAGKRSDVYSVEEMLIRDCYDALLDRLDRLGALLRRRLVSAADLAPYIRYYLDDIAAATSDPIEALWTVSLLTYIHFYHFTNVVILFQEFHHDVSPNGKPFKALMKAVADPQYPFAETLQGLAAREAAAETG